MSPNTILILGAGPRIGWSVAQRFKTEGYGVAIGSRSPDVGAATKAGFLPITLDVTNIQSIEAAFAKVSKDLGTPNVVVYNAAALTFPKDPANPFSSIEAETYVKDLNLNVVGAYVAIKESLKGFERLGPEIPTAFIATGNVLPWQPLAPAFTLGSGKAALAHLISVGAEAYKESNYRFYFASQVSPEGRIVQTADVVAAAHGEVYWELANEKEQHVWDVRFVGDEKIMPGK